uniref:Uncharacterized protein n=1 Tax=Hyaloperonospora arabidopsidis (strain Emoy2) TaxID=559515 RepID=M4BNG4_HYAAE
MEGIRKQEVIRYVTSRTVASGRTGVIKDWKKGQRQQASLGGDAEDDERRRRILYTIHMSIENTTL